MLNNAFLGMLMQVLLALSEPMATHVAPRKVTKGFGQVLALRAQRLGYSPKNTCHLSRRWGFLEDPLAPRHKANAQMQ